MTVAERDNLISILVNVTEDEARKVAADVTEEFQQALPTDVFNMIVVWYSSLIGGSTEGVLRAIARMPDDVLQSITVMFANPSHFEA